MSMHDGHRERMRQRISRESLENFASHEVLEVMLYYCIPRGDTNEIAHRLIKKYKTITRILEASQEDLESVEGVGPRAALFLNLMNQMIRYVHLERNIENTDKPFVKSEDYVEYIENLFVGLTNEVSYLVCLNADMTVIDYYKVGEGDVVSTPISIRKIVETSLKVNAAAVILAHNHPHGFALPSNEDLVVTSRIQTALKELNIVLLDHLVVSGRDSVSLVTLLKQRSRFLRQYPQEMEI